MLYKKCDNAFFFFIILIVRQIIFLIYMSLKRLMTVWFLSNFFFFRISTKGTSTLLSFFFLKIYSYMPQNINYSFNFGVILILLLVFLIITGLLNVIFCDINLSSSFTVLILKNLNAFFYFLLRVLHNSCANLFFLFIFFHIFRS